jgi:hypothetical protein
MTIYWVVGIGIAYLVLCTVLLLVVRPRVPAQRIQVIARHVGLPVSAELEPTIRTTQRGELRTIVVVVTLGIVAATVGMLIARIDLPGQIFWIDFTATIATLGIGSAIGTVRREGQRQQGDVRVARLRAVSLSDYRSPYEQWMPRIIVALALGGLALRGAVDPSGFAIVPVFMWVYAAITLASLLLSEFASRAIIRGGQPAGSELELAWDDALKSRALNSIAMAPIYLGAYFGVGTVAFFPPTHTGPTADAAQLEIGLGFVAVVLVLIWAGIAVVSKPQQRYRRRLWPQFVDGKQKAPTGATEIGVIQP